ncbi:hypothetical protein HHK36_008167 [Tetracentron sinense]|uniref:NAC domain-containing protein n=1 Tax=Tetracentron sinense TaxID=13715 RepID=A0A834ZPN2_TETSI|nr:hypothetical protein HHK36_008167 [Tetracentron sinense]
MLEEMSMSINGQSRVPPGFRFHPTEEELLHYYLRKKVADQVIDLDVIQNVDLNKLEPWDIQGSTPQNEWYFFSHNDKKYLTGTRTNRATEAGFWKATGRDKVIYSSVRRIGMRKTLVFYAGRAPHGHKSDWIMYEYRLDNSNTNTSIAMEETTYEDGWVVCRLFKKKKHQKNPDIAKNSLITTDIMRTQMLNSGNDGGLEQILQHMGRTKNLEKEKSDGIDITITTTANNNNNNNNMNMRILNAIETDISNGLHGKFMQSQRQESLTLQSLPNNTAMFNQACESQSCYEAIDVPMLINIEASVTNQASGHTNSVYYTEPSLINLASLDRVVASHLNGQAETSMQLACFNNSNMSFCSTHYHHLQLPHLHPNISYDTSHDYNSEINL